MDTVATHQVHPRIELTCNGEKVRYRYAVASPSEMLCQLDLISEGEGSIYAPQVFISQRGGSIESSGSHALVCCGKNSWQFTYKAFAYGENPEKAEIFVAHPALRNIHTFVVDIVDETKGFFSVIRGHLVSRVSFMFENDLQSRDGGFLPSRPPAVSWRSAKPFLFSCTRDHEKYSFPEIPYLTIAPNSHKENIIGIPGIKIGNSYFVPFTEKKIGLYEVPLCARMLPPDIYGLGVRCSFLDHMLGHTTIQILSDDEVKIFSRVKRQFRDMLRNLGDEMKNETKE